MEFKVDIDRSLPPHKPKSFNLPLKIEEVLQQYIYAVTNVGIMKTSRSDYCCLIFLIAKYQEKIPSKHEWSLETQMVMYDSREINSLARDSASPIGRI